MGNKQPEHLIIVPEKEGKKLVFDKNDGFSAMFNPNKLTFSKSANWKSADASQRDVPELQFTNGDPRTLSIDLFFDTYDTPTAKKQDVREYTNRLFHLTTVAKHGDKHRPPVCRLYWGSVKLFFQGVLQQLEQQFTLFMEDGTPVRASSKCTFKEWWTNYDDLNKQDLKSSDIAKIKILKQGETLSSIAAEEFWDPSLWRAIAEENGIDNPLELRPGIELLIPVLKKTGGSNSGIDYD